MDKSLGARLARHPVIATLYGVEQADSFIDSAAEVGIVANVDLRRLQAVVVALARAGKFVIVNIDSCDGLSQDKAASNIWPISASRASSPRASRRSSVRTAQDWSRCRRYS